jgi:DNA polymerase-3 subunit beta
MSEFDLTISKQDLSRMLSRAVVATDQKSSLATVSNVFLFAEEGRLTVRASDTYLGVESSAAIDLKAGGTVALDARKAAEAAKSLPGAEARLRLVKNQIEVTSGKTKFKLGTFDTETLPNLPSVAEAVEVGSVDTAVLARVLANGSYAADTDSTRHDQCGAFVEVMAGMLRVQSFDRNRIAEASAQVDMRDFAVFVPSDSLIELRKLCESAKGQECTLFVHPSNIFVRVGDTVMSAKLGDVIAAHRLYGKIITNGEKSAKHEVTMHRDALIGAVKRVGIVNMEKVPDRVANVDLHFSEGLLRLTAANTTADEGEDTVECDSGIERTVRLAPKFLLDALSAVVDDDVVIGLGKPLDGVFISGAVSREHRAVVMPMDKGGK